MIAKALGLTNQYFLGDRLSVRMTLNSSGSVLGRQSHLPFGEDFAESGTQEKHHFTSYERDAEIGLDYAVNRYYAPNTGNFPSPDPVTDILRLGRCGSSAEDYNADLVRNPQSWSRYGYVVNDPINNIDPLGLSRFWRCMRGCVSSAGISLYAALVCSGACALGLAPACLICVGAAMFITIMCMDLCLHTTLRSKGPGGFET